MTYPPVPAPAHPWRQIRYLLRQTLEQMETAQERWPNAHVLEAQTAATQAMAAMTAALACWPDDQAARQKEGQP